MIYIYIVVLGLLGGETTKRHQMHTIVEEPLRYVGKIHFLKNCQAGPIGYKF
jgi:ethanolamine utilization cobalamin adenosyltransferase